MKDYQTIATTQEQGDILSGMVRHLKARLEEFDCVTLPYISEETGVVKCQVSGFSAQKVAKFLEKDPGIKVKIEEDCLCFCLRPSHRQETIDSIWGGLFHLVMG